MSEVSFDFVDVTFKNKFLNEVVNLFQKGYNLILKCFTDSISGLLDQELDILNYQIQNY